MATKKQAVTKKPWRRINGFLEYKKAERALAKVDSQLFNAQDKLWKALERVRWEH